MACEGDIDEGEVRRAAAVLADPDHWLHLAGLPSRRCRSLPGGDAEWIAAQAAAWAADQVFYAINPVPAGHSGHVTSGQIVRRRWLLVDVDPARPAEHRDDMATEAEKAHAVTLAAAVLEGLRDRGWPDPVEVDSGNGTHLLYRVDLPNDGEARDLVRRCLAALARLYASPGAAVDALVFDARRIAKLPGTMARKGTSTPERPHRRCRLLSRPEPLEIVPRPLLEALAALAGAGIEPPPPAAAPAWPVSVPTPAYAAAAVRNELARVAGESHGNRNNVLNDAAFRLFTMAANPTFGLSAEHVEADCIAAGLAAGLGEAEVRATVASARRAGLKSPRVNVRTDGPPPPRAVKPAAGQGQPAGGDDQWILEGDAGRIADGHDLDMPDVGQGAQGGPKVFRVESLGTILHKVYPEPRYAVHGLLCEGLNILFGAPKMGKSVLSLNLALTVAGGGRALGDREVSQGDVLYLSLEDQARRVKDRAVKMLNGLPTVTRDEAAKRLHVVTAWKRQDRGGLAMLDAWVRAAKTPSLIIIDVWNRYCPEARGNTSAYSQDADSMGLVKQLADHHGVTVLIVHHTRKGPPGGGKPDDWVAEGSGTLGLAGTADGLLGLFRERGNNQAHLMHTGRDGGEAELVVEFQPEHLVWRSLGTAAQHVTGRVQQKVLEFLRARSPYGETPINIAGVIGEQPDSVRRALTAMLTERLVNRKGHLWSWPVEDE